MSSCQEESNLLWPNQASSQLQRLCQDNLPRLRSYLIRRLGCKAKAEDVLQESLARLLKHYKEEEIDNPLAMLSRIALNIIRDIGRSEKSQRELARLYPELLSPAPPPSDPETELVKQQEARLLQAAIDNLPPRCKQVFLLHKIEALPQAEVANILGISRSGVEKHLARAYAQLRTELEKSGWWMVDFPASPKA